MKGIQHIEVSNRKVKFKLDLIRNITIIRGESGTGKTTLYNMISDYTRLQESSGVNLSSEKPCVALMDMDWQNQLSNTRDSIVFIDEGAKYISSAEFAAAIKASDNYYVLFTREDLHELPYSVEEVYEIKASGKFHMLKKRYPAAKRHRYTHTASSADHFDVLLTEDSGSGYQFFQKCFENTAVRCESAASNSAIFRWLNEHPSARVLVVADGAAFGAEMDRVLKLCQAHPGAFQLCLPESFEWLILKSGILREDRVVEILNHPSDYIESRDCFSWENYFEALLVQKTEGTPFQYTKSRLNPVYAQKNSLRQIASEIVNVNIEQE